MALWLGEYIVRGELSNTENYSTHGWLQLKGADRPVMIELTGNCSPDLRGRHFRFQVADVTEDDELLPVPLPSLAWHQVGPTGEMTASHRRDVPVEPMSEEEFERRRNAGEQIEMISVPVLHLEWHSQNGHIIVELVNPIIEIEGINWTPEPGQPFEDSFSALDITIYDREPESGDVIYLDDEEPEPEAEDESFSTIPGELQEALDRQSLSVDRAIHGEDDDMGQDIEELELMDHLITNEDGEPMGSIFEPKRLPRPEDLDDEAAEVQLKSLLGELALHGVAFHICRHYSPRDAYRLLIDQVIYEARVHPELRGTGWVQNFMTSDYCPQCEAEIHLPNEDEGKKREEE